MDHEKVARELAEFAITVTGGPHNPTYSPEPMIQRMTKRFAARLREVVPDGVDVRVVAGEAADWFCEHGGAADRDCMVDALADIIYRHLTDASGKIKELEADQQDWRKGVELIRSAAFKGRSELPGLSCVRIAERVMEIRAENERLREALAWLAGYFADAEAVRSKCASLDDNLEAVRDCIVMEWPVVQGTRNQITLKRIAEHAPKAVSFAVFEEALAALAPNSGEGADRE